MLRKFLKISAHSLVTALPPTRRTTLWLLKIMVPVSLLVTLLQYFGVIAWIARYTSVLFSHMGLPGEAAIPFVSGALCGTYGGIASMMAMTMSLREATILALMICLCHGLPMESAVVRKTGSSFWKMTLLRIVMAIVCAFVLNFFLPEMPGTFGMGVAAEDKLDFVPLLEKWAWDIVKMSAMVLLIIYGLMVVQKILEAYDGIRRISKALSPLMRIFGLPESTSYMWLVANVLGISYGCAVMMDLEERGVVTHHDANEANYHLVMNHSMVEDTIVFAAVGISAVCVVATRVSFALLVVWSRKGLKKITSRNNAVPYHQ